ncbi:unnamed protein product [Coregonus sp. 'balchen']|nr:unnamed protein product [Coregonus sp. 'balchen']
MTELNNIKSSQKSTMEKKVFTLLQNCRENTYGLSDEALSEEFEIMWEKTLSEIHFKDFLSEMLRNMPSHVEGKSVNKEQSCQQSVGWKPDWWMWEKSLCLESECWWRQTKNIVKHWNSDHHRKQLQDLCDDIITTVSGVYNPEAREFQKMHDDFIEVNDPRNCLDNSKNKYLTEFRDLFHDRDKCQKKAEDFTKLCLQPAVRDL